MGDYEDILERLRNGEIDGEEAASQLDRFKGSSLREKAEKVPALERELAEARAEADHLKRAPKRDKAFREYGVDFDDLRPAEVRAIESYDGELEPEHVGAFVEELGLPMAQAAPPATGTEPNAQAVTRAARTAPARQRVGAAGQMTPDEAAQRAQDDPVWWDTWATEHPVEAELLERGKTVTV